MKTLQSEGPLSTEDLHPFNSGLQIICMMRRFRTHIPVQEFIMNDQEVN